jgi:capsular polysaccharide biosynthesis protein
MATLSTFLTKEYDPTALAPADESPRDEVRVGRYWGFLRRQWPVLLALVVLGGVIGAVRSAQFHRTYTSTVAVLAPPVAVETGLPSVEAGPFVPVEPQPILETMDTEAQIATSGLVLEQLKHAPGFNIPADRLAERVTVTASPYSRVLVIGVSANRPGNARQGARVVSRTFVRVRNRVIGQYQVRNRQAINRRIAVLQAELKALPPDPNALARVTVRTRRQAMQRQILDAQGQLLYADQFAQVVRAPDRPTHPDDPSSDVNRTSGMGVGLLAGLVIGLVRDRRPRRLRYVRDVRRRIPVPILTEPGQDDIADAGRRLRNLAFAEDARTVLVTGMPGETADPIAVSVAAAFAHGGAPTTLLRVSDELMRIYPGEVPEVKIENDDDLGTFRVEALSAEEGDRGLADAVERAHHGRGVVVISGPSLTTAEAVTLAALSDITVVTIALKQLTDRPLIAAIAHLISAGAPPRGIVITHRKRAS